MHTAAGVEFFNDSTGGNGIFEINQGSVSNAHRRANAAPRSSHEEAPSLSAGSLVVATPGGALYSTIIPMPVMRCALLMAVLLNLRLVAASSLAIAPQRAAP